MDLSRNSLIVILTDFRLTVFNLIRTHCALLFQNSEPSFKSSVDPDQLASS